MSTTITSQKQRQSHRLRLLAALLAFSAVAAACTSDGDDNTISLGQEPLAADVESGEVESSASGEVVDFTYQTFDGESLAFADLPDGPVVLNFFASWCPTCISELPDFELVANQLEGQVTFLGLGTNDRASDSAELVERTGVTFATGSDESGEIYGIFEGIGMPTTVFLDADHQVVRVHSGVFNAETLTETINTDLLS